MRVVLQGEWSTGTLYLDGSRIRIDDQGYGFSWGSHSFGSIRLAHGILIRMFTPSLATRHCEVFSREIISVLPQTDFKVEIDLGKWLDKRERKLKSKRRSR